LILA